MISVKDRKAATLNELLLKYVARTLLYTMVVI